MMKQAKPELKLLQSGENYHLQINTDEKQLSYRFVPVPTGSFVRKDKATVKLNAFYMAEFTVTQELYFAIMDKNPSRFKGEKNPVEQVSWYDALAFCERLNLLLEIDKPFYAIDREKIDEQNKNTYDKLKWTVTWNAGGRGFRLPTEAEWEYAARGAGVDNTEYAGSNVLEHVAWFDKNNAYETKPVGLKFPNALGLNDMSGNVWEWCWDWLGAYDDKNTNNPIGTQSGLDRINRGGSWDFNAGYSRVARRGGYDPRSAYSNLGFRLVLFP
jgi:formylglycine-generating enzyme required for sulfatase activity